MAIEKCAGFTLVEVLVASAITVASMGVLMNLFASSLDRMSRIEILSQRLIAQKEVVTRLAMVNPAELRAGEGQVGQWSYTWQVQPLTSFGSLSYYADSEAPSRTIALFRVNVEMSHPRSEDFTFDLNKLGWQS